MHGREKRSVRKGTRRRLVISFVIALATLAVLPAAALADTHTWAGTMPGGNWNNAVNWSPAGVPRMVTIWLPQPRGPWTATNDAYLLNSVGSVALYGPMTIDSTGPITLLGSLTAH